jgi:hypothetical protein
MDYNKAMWMWPLLFSAVLFAQEMESEKYCFSSIPKREKIQRELKGILLPVDQVTVSDSCLLISMKPHRRELIQNYIRTQDPNVSVSFSSAEIKREPCRLKVEKIKHSNESHISVTGEQNIIDPLVTQKKAEASETMQVQTLKNFELQYLQEVIKGECRFITPERYEVTINVRKDPKPYLPPLPSGSIVNITSPPPDQETSALTTTVQLTRGSRIEIGSVVKELRAKNHEIKSNPKVDYEDRSNSTVEEIYLSID